MLWDKGVGEFVAAARTLQAEGLRARFALVGDSDDENPASVHASQLRVWEKEGVIEWWGWKENMDDVYAQTAIVCLPSYREGVPKTLIEAAACGLPIVTSDVPGCREVVRHGENGLLVPVRDAGALARALVYAQKSKYAQTNGNPQPVHCRKRIFDGIGHFSNFCALSIL
jgi:glycosyltransferase involved in cell wall biosynthesis